MLLLFVFIFCSYFCFFILYLVCTIFHVPACSSTFCLSKLYVAGIDCYVTVLQYYVRGMCKCCVQLACLFENLTFISSFLLHYLELFQRHFAQ